MLADTALPELHHQDGSGCPWFWGASSQILYQDGFSPSELPQQQLPSIIWGSLFWLIRKEHCVNIRKRTNVKTGLHPVLKAFKTNAFPRHPCMAPTATLPHAQTQTLRGFHDAVP
jgi:hypothetical protein